MNLLIFTKITSNSIYASSKILLNRSDPPPFPGACNSILHVSFMYIQIAAGCNKRIANKDWTAWVSQGVTARHRIRLCLYLDRWDASNSHLMSVPNVLQRNIIIALLL